MAQWLAQRFYTPLVGGSNPLRPPFLFQKLLRGFDGEVGAGDYFFGQQDVDSDFAVTLLVGGIATPKIPKPALVFSGRGFEHEAQLGEGELPVAVGGRALGQAEAGVTVSVGPSGRLRAIVNHDVPALVFSSGGPDEVACFGFDKLPR